MTAWNCNQCTESWTSCVDKNFNDGFCCTGEQSYKDCQGRYEYCSTGLKKDHYKWLTCPMYNCPAGHSVHEHNSFGEIQYISRKWGVFDNGANCKTVIKGNKKLNGKINVEIQQVTNVNLYIYLQPNHFSSQKYGTHGILENNKIHTKVTRGIYTVPTDWSIWLVYNPPIVAGEIRIKTWAQEYSASD
jgi:hypothetical protein